MFFALTRFTFEFILETSFDVYILIYMASPSYLWSSVTVNIKLKYQISHQFSKKNVGHTICGEFGHWNSILIGSQKSLIYYHLKRKPNHSNSSKEKLCYFRLIWSSTNGALSTKNSTVSHSFEPFLTRKSIWAKWPMSKHCHAVTTCEEQYVMISNWRWHGAIRQMHESLNHTSDNCHFCLNHWIT